MNRDFKGIWIPFKLIDRLKPNFNLISQITNHYYFLQAIQLPVWEELSKMGLAIKHSFTPDEVRSLVGSKSPQVILGMRASEKCSWCKCMTYRLHSHHFPLSKKEGGSVTVEICASCHDEYHFLSECFYSLSDEVYFWFKEVSNV